MYNHKHSKLKDKMNKQSQKDKRQISKESSAAKRAVEKNTNSKTVHDIHKKNKKPKQPVNIFAKIGFNSGHLKYALLLFGFLALGFFSALAIMGTNDSKTEKINPTVSVNSIQPNIFLSSPANSVIPGQNFSVSIKENSSKQNVNAVQATVSFPSDLLDVVSVDSSESNFKINVFESTQKGKITVTRGQIGGLMGEALIAKVNFRAKASGKATIKFENDTALMSSTTNTNILNSSSNLKEMNLTIN